MYLWKQYLIFANKKPNKLHTGPLKSQTTWQVFQFSNTFTFKMFLWGSCCYTWLTASGGAELEQDFKHLHQSHITSWMNWLCCWFSNRKRNNHPNRRRFWSRRLMQQSGTWRWRESYHNSKSPSGRTTRCPDLTWSWRVDSLSQPDAGPVLVRLVVFGFGFFNIL